MFQVCLSALITKMCWVRVLPMKRFCVPSSRKVSVPKSTHYANWIRLFSLFPQRLHHHLGIKAWCCNLCRSLRRSMAAGWRVSSQGRCSWESLLCVSFQQTTVFAHMYLFQLHICYGVHRYAPCLFVFFAILNVLFLHLHVFKCECFGNFFACGCLCMCHMRVCVSESSRGRSSKNDSVSVAVRNSNPLISSQSLLPPSCHCASGIPLGLSPPPVPFEGSYPGNWKLFSNKDKRREKSTDTAKMGSLKGMWWRGLWFKKFFIEVNWILLWVLLL